MTTIKWLTPKLGVLLVVAMAPACGLETGGGGPSDIPTSTQPPAPTAMPLFTWPFQVQPATLGFGAPSPGDPMVRQPGKLIFEARWDPRPPEGQVFLFLFPFNMAGIPNATLNACYRDPMCPEALARDVSISWPKRVEYRLPSGTDRVYFLVRSAEGSTSGTVDISFLPDR